MPRSPFIVPHVDPDTDLVLNDSGRLGRAWCEADEGTDRETLLRRLLDDQYSHPVRIVGFDAAEGRSRDVTIDIGDELRRTLQPSLAPGALSIDEEESYRCTIGFMTP
ncbi:hypothetical protein [Bradyrhizobium sp. Gha]|uniref:hypothetical protein n=1 Tax=Bradyrhizobium sp. Gha TaxID=1855318 RepID=UPI0008E8B54C|nr:hypothetical protein [Bradyrhizobium sp. Gha]SFJ59350.1 hypothetical protein SAMN05216525_12936 [Bradyrhizobium sp. Gha]